jgi:hypothetical protein
VKPAFPALLLSAVVMLTSAHAQTAAPRTGCIHARDVDHMSTPDDRTILFHMRNGGIWRTTLTSLCPELSFNGFAYEVTPPDDICGNLQTIRVIRSGAICELGALTAAPDAGPRK